jgi:hypothetical protein
MDDSPAGRHDLGSLDLNILGAKPADRSTSEVQTAGYLETHEAVANPSPAETYQPASGREGIQR